MDIPSILLKKTVAVIMAMSNVFYPEGQEPETETERFDRKLVIAEASFESSVLGSSSKPEERISNFQQNDILALLIAEARSESAFDYYVHAGLPTKIGTQDKGRAKCLGQVQTWRGNSLLTDEEHSALVGTDLESTIRCFNAMHKYLWYHAERCRVRSSESPWSKGRMTITEARLIMAFYAKGSCRPTMTAAEVRNLDSRVSLWKKTVSELDSKEEPKEFIRPPEETFVESAEPEAIASVD